MAIQAPVVNVWYDQEITRYFISATDAVKYNIKYPIDPYKSHKPVTLEDMERLQNIFGVELHCREAFLEKQDIIITYSVNGDTISYFTKDYIIKSTGMKTESLLNEEITGKDVLLTEENYKLLTTYYNVSLIPVVGTPNIKVQK